jgi:DNA-binding FadR family transcriptional regulator
MAVLNIDFHDLLAAASGNTMLVELIGQVHRFVKRFRTTTFSHPNRAAEAVDEHDALLDAVIGGDADQAEGLARSHMRAALEVRIHLEAERATRS